MLNLAASLRSTNVLDNALFNLLISSTLTNASLPLFFSCYENLIVVVQIECEAETKFVFIVQTLRP